MNRWMFILSLGALLTAARAELPIDLPPDTPTTNRPGPGINVPTPLGGNEPSHAVAVPPSAEPPDSPPIPQPPNRRQPLQRIEIPARGQDCLTFANGDRFAGALLDVEGGVIRWQSPALQEPIRFRTGIARVIFNTDETGGHIMASLSEPITNRTARPMWVGLAVNRKSGELALYLDGQLQRRGMLIGPLNVADFGLAAAGGNPRFVVVSRLNGDINLPVPPADQDAVRLANSDQLAGKVESVTTNEFVIQAATGRLVLPLERLAHITFARGTPVAPRADEALVALHDGTLVRGVWQRTDAQSAVVQHAVLGPVTALRHVVLREWREDPAPAPAQQLPAPAARTPADARVILHNGDFLTLSDVTADARSVSGRHALLGPLAVNLAAVRALDWNRPAPSAPAPAAKR